MPHETGATWISTRLTPADGRYTKARMFIRLPPDGDASTYDAVIQRQIIEQVAVSSAGSTDIEERMIQQEIRISNRLHLVCAVECMTEIWYYVIDAPTSRALLRSGAAF